MKKSWIARWDGELSSRINGTNGNDNFRGDAGNSKNVDIRDVYDGRGGNDLIVGYEEEDRLWGSGGNDTIYGGRGRDRIFGGSGNDTLAGGMHDDRIKGGGGADVFIFDAWRSDDEFFGSGNDIIADFDPRQHGERIHLGTLYDDGIATFADLKDIMVQDGDNVNMQFDGGLAMLVLKDVKIGQLHADDFHIYYG
jgi:Ca2+-binding RTX toxin-like protein